MNEGRSGMAVVPARLVRLSDQTVRIGRTESAEIGQELREPKVEFVREDGVIRVIEVTCTCGNVIQIRCDY